MAIEMRASKKEMTNEKKYYTNIHEQQQQQTKYVEQFWESIIDKEAKEERIEWYLQHQKI